ncbi:MAG: glycosyltransferase family 2 protein [Sedimenticola sp.]|nr:glycosyltransferase family 2 protein [Sedimenticola sp.]
MSKLPLSVFIVAKNEADRITTTINSVREFVDEIIVVDSGSDDQTVEVSTKLGAQVIYNPWEGYGQQKAFAEKQCRNEWVLNLDADEEVSPQLGQEIVKLFESGGPACSAYTLPMLPVYSFQEKPYPWMLHNHPVRLYNRQSAYYHDDAVHDSVIVKSGDIGHLSGHVLHRSFRSLAHHVEKMNFYSDAQAKGRSEKGKYPTFFELLVLPLFAFLKCYFFRRAFLMGTDGIVLSHMYAFQRFLRIAKTRELRTQRKTLESRSTDTPD